MNVGLWPSPSKWVKKKKWVFRNSPTLDLTLQNFHKCTNHTSTQECTSPHLRDCLLWLLCYRNTTHAAYNTDYVPCMTYTSNLPLVRLYHWQCQSSPPLSQINLGLASHGSVWVLRRIKYSKSYSLNKNSAYYMIWPSSKPESWLFQPCCLFYMCLNFQTKTCRNVHCFHQPKYVP